MHNHFTIFLSLPPELLNVASPMSNTSAGDGVVGSVPLYESKQIWVASAWLNLVPASCKM